MSAGGNHEEAAVQHFMEIMKSSREESEAVLQQTGYDVDKAVGLMFNGVVTTSVENKNSDFDSETARAVQQSLDQHTTLQPPQASYEGSGASHPSLVESRDPEMDPMLLSTDDSSTIPALLSVLHKIPLARKALLSNNKDLTQEYTQNWSSTPHTLDGTDAEKMAIECQRVIAFLDGESQRKAVDISQLEGLIDEDYGSGQLINELFRMVRQNWSNDDGDLSEFLSSFTKIDVGPTSQNPGYESDSSSDGYEALQERKHKQFINLKCDASPAVGDTIYSVLDNTFTDPKTACPGEKYLTDLGDVVMLTVKRDDMKSGAGIAVPEFWYPGRYTPQVQSYLTKLDKLKRDLLKKRDEIKNLQFSKAYDGGNKVEQLLKVTQNHLQTASNSHGANMAAVHEAFKSSMQELADQQEACQSQLQDIKNMFMDRTSPQFSKFFADADEPKLAPYQLCGVVVSPQEFCYRQREEQLIEDASGESSWCFVSATEQSKVMINSDSLCRLATHGVPGTSQPLPVTLVYANEKAMDRRHQVPVSKNLDLFFEEDRLVFSRVLGYGTADDAAIDSGEESSDEEGPQTLPADPATKIGS